MAARSSKSTAAARGSRREGRRKRVRRSRQGRPPQRRRWPTCSRCRIRRQLAKYAKSLTPEQAFEMYRANAKLALEVIESALESTAKVRKLQYEGEERARSMQRKTARSAAEAGDVQSLMAVGQTAAQEAVEQSIQYWGQMFELIVEMQKRLFSLMESKAAGCRGRRRRRPRWRCCPT